MRYLFYSIFMIIMGDNISKYQKVYTPDNNFFHIHFISKKEADQIESRYKMNSLDSTLLSVNSKVAYKINGGKILYRQFYQDIGFVFPTLEEYKRVILGKTYWKTSIQLNNRNEFVVAFLLKPAEVNFFLKSIVRELSEYESFENWKFFTLTNNKVIMFRKRTETLSEGYWFNSIPDFVFFYHILSGK